MTNHLENDGKDLEGVGQGLDLGHGNDTHHQGQSHTRQGHLLGHPVPDLGQDHLDPAQGPNLGKKHIIFCCCRQFGIRETLLFGNVNFLKPMYCKNESKSVVKYLGT